MVQVEEGYLKNFSIGYPSDFFHVQFNPAKYTSGIFRTQLPLQRYFLHPYEKRAIYTPIYYLKHSSGFCTLIDAFQLIYNDVHKT